MIVFLAKLLRKAGFLGPAARFLHFAGRLRPRSAAVLREYCINRMSARDFAAVQSRCAQVAALSAPDEELQDQAAYWMVRSDLQNQPPQDTLAKLQNSYRQAAAEALRFFEGATEAAGSAFQQALHLSGIPEGARTEWIAAFDALSYAAEPAGFEPATDTAPKDTPQPVNKIAVSGMYWSGSGAIFDFLREFDQIAPVYGELRLWKEGDFCLRSVQDRLNGPPEVYRRRLLRFLLIALLGVSPVHNWQEQMAVDYALAAARSDIRGTYAAVCRRFIQNAASIANEDSVEAFTAAAGRLTDGLARLWSDSRAGDTVLFDNIVHIGAVDAAGLLGEQAKVLCAFRDPRSTFAARWFENPRFDRDVEGFIAYYRHTVENFERTIASRPDLAEKVVSVSFERFVLSEQYREELAASCGLDTHRRQKGSLFNPEFSRKNVRNYENFPHQELIQKIERELGEYCYDFSTGDVHG